MPAFKQTPHSASCPTCPACGSCFLARWDSIPAPLKPAGIVRSGTQQVYLSGDYILHQESVVSLAPVVCWGIVAIMVMTEGGEERLLHALGPGHIVGLSDWLRRRGTSSIVAKAATDVGLSFVTAGDPLQLLNRQPLTGPIFLQQIGMQLHDAQRATISLLSDDAYSRILLAIRELVRLLRLHREGPITIPHKIPRWFFASLTGLRPETVSRMLTQCRKEGILAYRNRLIVISDLGTLESRINRYAHQ